MAACRSWGDVVRASVLLIGLVAVLAGGCASHDRALEPRDLAAPHHWASESVEPPSDLARRAPARWRGQIPEVQRVLTQTIKASFLEPRVWAASTEKEAAAAVLAALGSYLDRDDLVTEVLDGLRRPGNADAQVITDIASVFPRDAQPESAPFVYRSMWSVEDRNGDVTVTAVVLAGYDVSRRADRTPVLVGRTFSIRLSPGVEGSTAIDVPIGGAVWLADGCSVVVDGQFRATDRLPDQALQALRHEFADTSPADPLAALVPAAKAGHLEAMTASDERRCLAKSTREH